MRLWRAVQRSLALLERRDRVLLVVAAIAQLLVGLLDLLAIYLLAFVATSAATRAQPSDGSFPAPSQLPGIESIFGDPSVLLDPESLMALAAIAGLALATRSLTSFWLTRRIYRFLAGRQGTIAGTLWTRLLARPMLEVQQDSSQSTSYALTAGMSAAIVNTLGPVMVVGAEASLIALLTIGLILVDPLVALFTLVFFGTVAFLLHLTLGKWASEVGERSRVADVQSAETLQHAMRAYREVAVTGRRKYFVDTFVHARWVSSRAMADTFTISQVGKYVFEIGLVVGGGLLVFIVAQSRSLSVAVGILTVFLVTTSRLMPSLLRLQTAFVLIRQAETTAAPTFDLATRLAHAGNATSIASPAYPRATDLDGSTNWFEGFEATVDVRSVHFKYPGAVRKSLDGVSLSVPAGGSIAIVGPTGSGKTTLVDIVLGVLTPDSGEVRISGCQPTEAIKRWPGAIAYVPQDVSILTGSIRRNVAIGIPESQIDDELVWEALDRARLADFVHNRTHSLDDPVGEHGVRLSGGQRQRLGIARALYSQPRLLVLDEATSALDAQTEQEVLETLDTIAGHVTTIVIAHRLATVRRVGQVIYLDGGRIAGCGSFDEVRAQVPHFDAQANLLGLPAG